MRQGPNSRRARGRNNSSNRRPNLPNRNQTFDSNGPEVRIRGNAYQVHEKYLALSRDASAAGDRIMAENYLQHAEHYYRIITSINEAYNQTQQTQPSYEGGREQRDNGQRDGGQRDGGQRDNGQRDDGQRDGSLRDGAFSEGARDFGQRDFGQRDFGQRDFGQRDNDPRDVGGRELEFGADPRGDDETESRDADLSANGVTASHLLDGTGDIRADGALDEGEQEPAPPPRPRRRTTRPRRPVGNGATEGAGAVPEGNGD